MDITPLACLWEELEGGERKTFVSELLLVCFTQGGPAVIPAAIQSCRSSEAHQQDLLLLEVQGHHAQVGSFVLASLTH